MSELSVLVVQRDQVLEKIHEIEEAYEGIENENNAKGVQKLNLEHAQLLAQKQEISSRLVELEARLVSIDTKIGELSGVGVEKILEAIKKQRWYFFKNKVKIIFDKNTGLIWPNLNYFNIGNGGVWEKCTGPWEYNSSISFLNDLEIEGISNWMLPTKQQIVSTLDDREFPFYSNSSNCSIKTNTNGYVYSLRILNGSRNCLAIDKIASEFNEGNWNCGIFPCNNIYIRNSDYANNILAGNPNYNETERLQFTLDLFVQNNLWPIFDDEEITELYKKIYFEKPKLLGQLQLLQSQIDELQTVTLLSSEFDYTALLAKYDIKSIDDSVIKYYQAVQQWCNELMEKLDYYEKEKETVIRDFNIIGLKLSKKYDENHNLTEDENKLLSGRQRYFQKNFSLGMNSVKNKILAVKKQADDLEYRIDEIDNGENSIHDLAVLEQEQRASFSFIAENTAKIIKNALLKIEFFEAHHEFVMNAINIWESWTEDYKIFKTTYKEDMKHDCEDDGIEEEIWSNWYKDWQQLRYAIELKVQPVIEWGLKGEIPVNEEKAKNVPERLIEALEEYKNNVDGFYKEERKGIYQKFVFQAGGDLQDKFETESGIYKYTAAFQSTLQDIIFNCKNAEDRVFILNWANNLLDIQIDEILDFVADNDLQKISHTILNEFAALKQKNYDIYLADVKAYSEEKSRREKEYNSLIFKMRKDLMKQ